MEEWQSAPEVRTIVPYGDGRHLPYGSALPRQCPPNIRFRYGPELGNRSERGKKAEPMSMTPTGIIKQSVI